MTVKKTITYEFSPAERNHLTQLSNELYETSDKFCGGIDCLCEHAVGCDNCPISKVISTIDKARAEIQHLIDDSIKGGRSK